MKLIFDYDENITGHVPSESVNLELPKHLLRNDLPLPNVNEVDVVRHYTDLSRKNFGIDLGIYPLGSCTMKYNPKVNENLARLKGFSIFFPRLTRIDLEITAVSKGNNRNGRDNITASCWVSVRIAWAYDDKEVFQG